TRAATALRAGLGLWRGDPLADCPVAEWGDAEITRLRDARISAAEALAEADLLRGEHVTVAGDLERLVALHPLRERLWELLMIAHHRVGRQDEALRAYRRAREVLGAELGLEPGPRLRGLQTAVLEGAADLDPSTAPVTAPIELSRVADSGPDLPIPPAGLVGRQRELTEVLGLVANARLVTLTGAGGCGKTRLAVTAAAEVARRGRAVTLVDLTPVSAPDLVADAVITAMGLTERQGASRVDTIAEAAGARLVVLDNCEHLVRACAELVGELLAACPRLTVLATSREALRVAGETAYAIAPLAVPDPDQPRTLSELAVYDSVRLFIDRAGQDFTEDDAPAIAQLCAALDGLPLAIELAAARCRVLTPAQIVQRLRDRFGLLTLAARGAPDHHRTLRAALAWSLDLLTEDEAALFTRLGVFAGGFSVDAAEAVWEPDRALDALSGLVGKSLVRVRRQGDSTRFSMLETIAAYAGELLRAEPDTEQRARREHAEHFRTLAEEADADPTGVRFTRLRTEHDNLRAAMSWFARSPDTTGELRLAAALGRYCHLHGHYREGRQWLDHALARAEHARPQHLARALAAAAALALFECDYAQAQVRATEGLRLCQALDDHRQAGRMHRILGSVAREQARYPDALRAYAAAEASFRTAADPSGAAYSRQLAGATSWLADDFDNAEIALTESLTWLRDMEDRKGAASSTAYLGAVALYRGEHRHARHLLDDALDAFGEMEFKEGIAWAQNLLGLLEHATGSTHTATSMLTASLTLHRDLGDRWRQASVLEALAAVAGDSGDPAHALRLLRQADEIRTAIGAPIPLVERRRPTRLPTRGVTCVS
ncbi:ATP-binding protein, partial [Actinokineospora sp.]|uniref:ATP-binding protein n=1 Tax=Actinokineospora sp. TaxID=1872133 RepID=UPI003D6A5CE5